MRGSVVALAAGVLLPAAANAQTPPTLHALLKAPSELKIAASVRVRFEAIDGQARPGFNNADELVSLRATLFAEYNFGPINIGGEVRDARVYDARPRTPLTTSEVNALEPVQAYVGGNLRDLLGAGSATTLQAGRMIVSVGSTRLLTSEEFRNTANGYTGVRADYKAKSGAGATLFWLLPQVRLPDDRASIGVNRAALDRESLSLTFWGALVTTPKLVRGGAFDIGYFRLVEQDRPGAPTRDRRLDTFDFRFFRAAAPGKLDWEAEGAYQIGSISVSAAPGAQRLSVDANFFHVSMGYTWKIPWSPRLLIEYDYASGDAPGGNFSRFDTLFGGRRQDFAPSGIYNEINRANVSTPGARLELTPSKRLDMLAEVRGLFLAQPSDAFATTNVRDPLGLSGTYAGTQVDARIRYWLIPKALRTEVNLDYLAKGRFLRNAPNAPRNGDTRFGAISLIAYF